MLEDFRGSSPVQWFMLLFPMVMVPVGLVLFAWRKKEGWAILASHFIMQIIQVLGMFIYTRTVLVNYFGAPEISPYDLWEELAPLLLYGSFLWVLGKKEIREIYRFGALEFGLFLGLSFLLAGWTWLG